jgi:hypothetical protein
MGRAGLQEGPFWTRNPGSPKEGSKPLSPDRTGGTGAGRGFMMGKDQEQGGSPREGMSSTIRGKEADTPPLPDFSPSEGHQAADQPGIAAAVVV